MCWDAAADHFYNKHLSKQRSLLSITSMFPQTLFTVFPSPHVTLCVLRLRRELTVMFMSLTHGVWPVNSRWPGPRSWSGSMFSLWAFSILALPLDHSWLMKGRLRSPSAHLHTNLGVSCDKLEVY